MSASAKPLKDKRVLITDVENEFGKEFSKSLEGEGALIFTFVKESCQMQQVVKNHPDVISVLLDISKDSDEAYKLLASLPTLDHIINLSGDNALSVISKAYPNWKINDFGENKTKPLISKMKDAGCRGLIFHSSAGNHNMMSKLKANLNPRYTDSATAHVSMSVRKSFKKLFTMSSTADPPVETSPGTAASNLAETIVESKYKAMNFAAAAESLGNGTKKGSLSPSVSNDVQGAKTPINLAQQQGNYSEKNEKIREAGAKLSKKTIKKWDKLIKNIQKDQLTKLKTLEKEIKTMKKKDKTIMMGHNAERNAETLSRAGALSAETANQIVASREAKVEREVEKRVDKKRDLGTQKIAEDKTLLFETLTDKLYHKMIAKQIAEFQRIKVKYLI